jgi:hypothetical protein
MDTTLQRWRAGSFQQLQGSRGTCQALVILLQPSVPAAIRWREAQVPAGTALIPHTEYDGTICLLRTRIYLTLPYILRSTCGLVHLDRYASCSKGTYYQLR